jgi:aspartate/methionine/tyrosine aminotransferase
VISAAIKVHQFVNTAASTFSQRVALELFAEPGGLGHHRRSYREGRARLLATAESLDLAIVPPEGAFYGFIRLTGSYASDSLGFAERLLDEYRVVSVPGRAFGESGEGWLRISWVASADAVEEGLRRIARSLDAS